jgi:hypothetical protein
MEPEAPLFAIWGSLFPIRLVNWANQSQVGGRAHEPQSCSTYSFVWYGGGNAHPNHRGDAFRVVTVSTSDVGKLKRTE